MSDIIMLGIEYEEFEPDTYAGVYIYLSQGNKQIINTGNVVKDFYDALSVAKSLPEYKEDTEINLYNESLGNIVYSSTIDNFLMDTNDKYKFDDSFKLVKNREDK
jgi:hypothetical protein